MCLKQAKNCLDKATHFNETLDAGYWIMTGWPVNFLKICEAPQIQPVRLLAKLVKNPFWYEDIVRGRLFWRSSRTSEGEIESAVRTMEKMGRMINIQEVRELLGYSGTCKIREILEGMGYRKEDVKLSDPRKWGKNTVAQR
jgi:hypothetical protein